MATDCISSAKTTKKRAIWKRTKSGYVKAARPADLGLSSEGIFFYARMRGIAEIILRLTNLNSYRGLRGWTRILAWYNPSPMRTRSFLTLAVFISTATMFSLGQSSAAGLDEV